MALANITNNILTDSGILVTNLTPTTRTLTINGTTYDLSADRSWTIATGVGGSGTTNYLPKFTGASTIGNSNLINDASGNLGLGVTPSAWALYKAIQVQGASIANFDTSDNSIVGSNVFYGGSPTDFRYISTGTSTMYRLNGGAHYWFQAPSGTAGNAISFTQAMTLDASGRLGIGTTSPAERLSVAGAIMSTGTITGHGANRTTISQEGGSGAFWQSYGANTSTVGAFVLRQASSDFSVTRIPLSIDTTGAATFSSSVTASNFYWGGTTNNNLSAGSISMVDAGTGTKYLQFSVSNTVANIATNYSNNNIPLTLNSYGNTNQLYLATSGNVGIGTTSPAYKLEVNNSTGDNHIAAVGTAPSLQLMSANTGPANWATIGMATATNNFIVGSAAGDLAIANRGTTAGNMLFGFGSSESMRITSGGNLLVGTTTAGTDFTRISCTTATQNVMGLVSSDDSSGAGYIQFRNSATTSIGSIARVGTTNAVAFNVTSDYRLKEDLREIKGLEKISAIKVYDFKWKADGSRMDGVIAHELQSVINYAVTGVKDGKEMQQVDYSKIVPVLIKSIQELKQELDTLKNK
jgi:hypothetical protein